MINVNLTGSLSPELTPITFPINRLAECTDVVPYVVVEELFLVREVNEAEVGAVSDRRWEDASPRRVQVWAVQSSDSLAQPKQYTIPASKLLPILVKPFQWQSSDGSCHDAYMVDEEQETIADWLNNNYRGEDLD